ncbi:hypothetical protein [Leptospira noguchii]|uniref:hypothetical protein n=1 Tax=Leptospira noguchii TaxID=28182 RepID=UPI000773A95C|nr:hypothetical protein [Leptospira noguchii]
MEIECYLITTRHKSIFGENWLLFWGPKRSGYTSDQKSAGIYNIDFKSKSLDYPICKTWDQYSKFKKRYGDFYVPVFEVKKKSKEFTLTEVPQ